MNYKIPFFILGFLIFSLEATFAQDTLQVASSFQKAEVIATRMERELSLSKNQTEKVKALAFERFEILKVKKSNFPAQLAQANNEVQRKLATILTSQQWELYQDLKNDIQKQKDEFVRKP